MLKVYSRGSIGIVAFWVGEKIAICNRNICFAEELRRYGKDRQMCRVYLSFVSSIKFSYKKGRSKSNY